MTSELIKTIKKDLFVLIGLLLSSVAQASDNSGIRLTYRIISEENHEVEVAKITYDSDERIDLIIPSYVTGNDKRYVVVGIGEAAFYGCYCLNSVTIPNTVTRIGFYAFAGSSVSSVIIPNSVKVIDYRAFSDCFVLTSLTIPNSVESIDNCAFEYSGLTSVTIPASVTSIGSSSFADCHYLTDIFVDDGNEYYTSENGVLYNFDKTEVIQCPGAKDEYIFPNTVSNIRPGAFSGCQYLTSVDIPNSVTNISSSSFSGCSNLTSIIIPNSVTSIDNSAFYKCKSLTSVNIPNSVTEIGSYVFWRCDGLESVVISKNIRAFESSLFEECKKLVKIIDLNPEPQIINNDVFRGVPDSAVVYIPKGSFRSYMLADGWTHFTDFREMGAFDVSLSVNTLELPAGDSATITATIEKDSDVSVGVAEWSSSNTAVATVDDGKVTAVAEGSVVIYYTVYDGYGVPHTESCVVTVTDPSVVESILEDGSTSMEVYTPNGVSVARGASATDLKSLPAGLYIIRQGSKTRKIMVK